MRLFGMWLSKPDVWELKKKRRVRSLAAALKYADVKVRERAAEALGEVGDKRASRGLTKALHDESADVRGRAVWALQKIAGEKAVEPLGLLLTESPNVKLKGNTRWYRASVARALGRIGGQRAREILRSALSNRCARVNAASALAEFGDQDAPGALQLALRKTIEEASTSESAFTPEDAGFIVAASEALSALGAKGTVDTIQMALPRLRGKDATRVSLALGELGDLRAVAPLCEALEDKELAEEHSLLERSAEFLAKSGDTTAFDTVRKILAYTKASKSESWASDVILACIPALAALDPKAAVDVLCEEYRESEHLMWLYSEIRSQIIKEIEPIADARAVDTLCEVLSGGGDESATVVQMLKRIGDPRGMALVREYEEQIAKCEEKRRNRALFCKRIRDLQSKDPQTSQEAKHELQTMAEKATPFILRAFAVGDESENPGSGPYERRTFDRELCQVVADVFPFPELVPRLTEILNDYHRDSPKDAVVAALSSIGPAAASARGAIERWLSYLMSAQSHRTDAIRDAKEALLVIDRPAGIEMSEADREQIQRNRKNGVFPCILCGKNLRAAFGSNTIFYKGRTFACCHAGCGRPEGAYDTSYEHARIEGLSERERCLSELPPELTL